jgi:flagellar secretion chaperone FliS
VNHARLYSQANLQTASRERLMVLLFETALRHMRAGAAALEAGQPADANHPLSRAAEIVLELTATLDRSQAPRLVDQLGAVYTFVSERLTLANLRHDAQLVREAQRAFEPLVDAFREAVASLPSAEAR